HAASAPRAEANRMSFMIRTASHLASVGDLWSQPPSRPPAASPLRLRAYGSLQGMVRVNRRALAVWLVLFGVYAATVGARAFDHSAYAGDEPRFLLTARSLAHDGNVNVFDEYRSNAYRGFYMHKLSSAGVPNRVHRTLYEPGGLGFPLLLAPAYMAGGACSGASCCSRSCPGCRCDSRRRRLRLRCT